MLVTSGAEMCFPGASELIVVSLDDLFDFPELTGGKMQVLGQLNLWFQPELRFSISAMDVNVHPVFFS